MLGHSPSRSLSRSVLRPTRGGSHHERLALFTFYALILTMRAAAALLVAVMGTTAVAMADTEVAVLLDTDGNPATGCAVATVEGTFPGVERRLVAVVDTHLLSPSIVSLRVQDCTDPVTGTFGPLSNVQGPFTPPWALGIHSVPGAPDIVEMYLSGISPTTVSIRVGVTAATLDGAPFSDALLTTASPAHAPIVILAPGVVPAASDLALALLAATLVTIGVMVMRRSPVSRGGHFAGALILAFGLTAASLYAQTAFVPDGSVGDWAGQAPLAVDDPPAGSVGSDIVAVYGSLSDGMLRLRADVRIVPNTVGVADSVDALENNVLTATAPGVLANDVGLGLAAVPITNSPTSQGGSVSLNADGGFVYTPPHDFFGTDTFSYTVHGLAGGGGALVTIMVAPVNQPPRFTVGPDFVLDVNPGPQSSAGWATGISPGPPNESSQLLTSSATITATTGTLAFDQLPSLSIPSGNLTFATRNGTYGTATVQITLRDDGGTANGGTDSVSNTFKITVDTPPVANDDQAAADEGVTCLELNLLTNDFDADGDALSAIITSDPINGALFEFDPPGGNVPSGSTTSGHLCYRPFKRFFFGTDEFTYMADDHRGGLSAPATVHITINHIN